MLKCDYVLVITQKDLDWILKSNDPDLELPWTDGSPLEVEALHHVQHPKKDIISQHKLLKIIGFRAHCVWKGRDTRLKSSVSPQLLNLTSRVVIWVGWVWFPLHFNVKLPTWSDCSVQHLFDLFSFSHPLICQPLSRSSLKTVKKFCPHKSWQKFECTILTECQW